MAYGKKGQFWNTRCLVALMSRRYQRDAASTDIQSFFFWLRDLLNRVGKRRFCGSANLSQLCNLAVRSEALTWLVQQQSQKKLGTRKTLNFSEIVKDAPATYQRYPSRPANAVTIGIIVSS